jgi:hypothetical protein
VNEVPEKGRDTTGQGRASGPHRNDHLDGAGRVSYLLSAVTLELTSSRGRRLRINVSLAGSGDDGRDGRGRGGAGRTRECGAVRTSVTDDGSSDGTLGASASEHRGNVKSSRGGIPVLSLREASPSAGWREVAVAMAAEEGCRHE